MVNVRYEPQHDHGDPWEEIQRRNIMHPKVDEDECTGCATCVEVCPSEVFEMGDDDISKVARPEECVECETCVEECPVEAIVLVD